MSTMFTTCPNCKLFLAVTAMDLRVGQGYVRCGRCDRVFNALISLAEDPDREAQSGLYATGTTSVPELEDEVEPPAAAKPEPEPEPEPEIELEPEPSDEVVPPRDEPAISARENWANITPIRMLPQEDVDVVETVATGTFETIVLEGDGFLQTEEHVDEEEVEERLQSIAAQIDHQELAAARGHLRFQLVDDEPAELEVEELDTEEVVMEDDPAASEEIDAEAVLGNAPRQHWGWKAGAAALGVLLLGQVVHHHRQALVAQSWAEAPLRGLYGLFGASLEPRWDLAAYDLRQLGGEAPADNPTKIVLRATVQNRAKVAQPPPMIRVTLQDRFGNALTTLAVAPRDYLKGGVPSRIKADQRLDALLTLDDPNKQAVGFELDACLPDAAGELHCSSGP